MANEITPITKDDTIASMISKSAATFSKRPALKVKDDNTFRTITYGQLFELVEEFGSGLSRLGLKEEDHIGLISDNRMEWLVSDLAIMGIGGVDVPRGTCSNNEEIEYILNHSDARAVILENGELLSRLKTIISNKIPLIKLIIVLEEGFKGEKDKGIYSFDEVIEQGRELLKKDKTFFVDKIRKISPDNLATIIYTSGTTGEPKGVMLTHKNIMHNVRTAPPLFNFTEDDSSLSVLPSWHIYERTFEYMVLRCGASIIYSKPIKQVFLEDVKSEKPSYMVCVPRIWEGIHKGILSSVSKQSLFKRFLFAFFLRIGKIYGKALRTLNNAVPVYEQEGSLVKGLKRLGGLVTKALLFWFYKLGERLIFDKIKKRVLGGNLSNPVSGGASLPAVVDEFFEAIGIPILEGYGLTETSPVVCTRRHHHRTLFTIGSPLPEVEVKIVDKNNNPLPPGGTGLLKIRGPLVMKGYYKQDDLTAQVIDEEGWFNSGDLAQMTVSGEVKITGRAKDTIVLLGGENVEPGPIEGKLKESPYIAQAVVVGQDKKYLGALITPDFEALNADNELNLNSDENSDIVKEKKVHDLIKKEVRKLVHSDTGFKAFERIYKFHLLASDFKVGRELTHTMKVKRNVVHKLYAKEIDEMYGR